MPSLGRQPEPSFPVFELLVNIDALGVQILYRVDVSRKYSSKELFVEGRFLRSLLQGILLIRSLGTSSEGEKTREESGPAESKPVFSTTSKAKLVSGAEVGEGVTFSIQLTNKF